MTPSLLAITFPSGYVRVVSFPSAFERALCIIALAQAPVLLRVVG
jgi:hypothetical protein